MRPRLAELRKRAARDAEPLRAAFKNESFRAAWAETIDAACAEDQQQLDGAWDKLAALVTSLAPDFIRLEREHASDVLHAALAYEVGIRFGLTREQATEHSKKLDPKGFYLSPDNADHFWIGAGGRIDSSVHNPLRSRRETDQFLRELRPEQRGRPPDDNVAWLRTAVAARDAVRRASKSKRVTQSALAAHADIALEPRSLQLRLARCGLSWREFLQLPSD